MTKLCLPELLLKDLFSAFKLLDTDESGFIDKDELWNALPLMSEDASACILASFRGWVR
jgi:Ca2+-binding EF-hand superfamily protein